MISPISHWQFGKSPDSVTKFKFLEYEFMGIPIERMFNTVNTTRLPQPDSMYKDYKHLYYIYRENYLASYLDKVKLKSLGRLKFKVQTNTVNPFNSKSLIEMTLSYQDYTNPDGYVTVPLNLNDIRWGRLHDDVYELEVVGSKLDTFKNIVLNGPTWTLYSMSFEMMFKYKSGYYIQYGVSHFNTMYVKRVAIKNINSFDLSKLVFYFYTGSVMEPSILSDKTEPTTGIREVLMSFENGYLPNKVRIKDFDSSRLINYPPYSSVTQDGNDTMINNSGIIYLESR